MDDERVKISSTLSNLGWWSALEVFLLVLSSLWVLVLEDEMDLILSVSNSLRDLLTYLVCGTALVRPKHDDIRRCVGKFLRV